MEPNSSQKQLVSLVSVKRRSGKTLQFLRDNTLLVAIIFAILIGFGLGIILKYSLTDTNKHVILWLTLPGQLFMRALELLIIPVVFIGVTAATSSLSPRNNLRITMVSIGLVTLTHLASVLTGLAGCLILTASSSVIPHRATNVPVNSVFEKQKDTYDIVADILRNLIPKNIVKAATNQELTRYYFSKSANGTVRYTRKSEYTDGANILGILTFSLLLGLASSVLEGKAELFREFFKSCNDVVLLALRWLIILVPVGIASLIIEAVFEVDDLEASLKKIALFTGICVACLVFYGTVVLSVIFVAFTRKNPLKYYCSFLEPALIAFCSTSEAVCIQKCVEVCDEKVKMDPRLSKFSIPFYIALQKGGMYFIKNFKFKLTKSAMIIMIYLISKGSAVFITISCVFVANYSGLSLSAGDYVVAMIMTSVLCLCLPAVPSSSIMTLLVILNAINFPSTNIAVLYTVEWLLDR
jgi:Na+/H+-dicarboxylate symporter